MSKYQSALALQQDKKKALREADENCIRSGQVRAIDLAKNNSCFSGANLQAFRSEKGFNLF
ncbi:MAG: hypothetical protein GY938_06215 [Ketobacter sp.]|nr:hypothetical protein [Ketobacter sp.]